MGLELRATRSGAGCPALLYTCGVGRVAWRGSFGEPWWSIHPFTAVNSGEGVPGGVTSTRLIERAGDVPTGRPRPDRTIAPKAVTRRRTSSASDATRVKWAMLRNEIRARTFRVCTHLLAAREA